jgi:hypothetical protein
VRVAGNPGDVIYVDTCSVAKAEWGKGYWVEYDKNATQIRLVLVHGTGSKRLGTYSQSLANGDAIGVRCIGSTIEAWARISGTWTKLGTATDTTISGASPNNKLAVWGHGFNTSIVDDFGGGLLPEYASYSISISASDTGTGSDSATLTAQISVTDAGAGADTQVLQIPAGTPEQLLKPLFFGIPNLSPFHYAKITVIAEPQILPTLVSDSDSGVGVDAAILTAQISASDIGTGADIATLIAAVVDIDAGVGSDTSALTAQISVTDTGTGIEAASTGVPITGTDVGTGIDAATLTVVISDTDSGIGSEASIVTVQITDTDTGVGSETQVLQTPAPAPEPIQKPLFFQIPKLSLLHFAKITVIVESQLPATIVQVSDTGTGTDTASVTVSVAVTDSGTSIEISQPKYSVSDSGTVTDTASITRKILDGSDAGSVTENAVVGIYVTDSGIGTDSGIASHEISLVVSDAGYGTDIAYFLPRITGFHRSKLLGIDPNQSILRTRQPAVMVGVGQPATAIGGRRLAITTGASRKAKLEGVE